ncbi:hypothetical protein P9869_39625 [Streptomyces ossamyceticus]|nr:hypothetical protein [Streptomyces ossamyceticus]
MARYAIQALASAGVDAFTIGSAAFDGSLQRHAGTLRSQLAPVVGKVAGELGSSHVAMRVTS